MNKTTPGSDNTDPAMNGPFKNKENATAATEAMLTGFHKPSADILAALADVRVIVPMDGLTAMLLVEAVRVHLHPFAKKAKEKVVAWIEKNAPGLTWDDLLVGKGAEKAITDPETMMALIYFTTVTDFGRAVTKFLGEAVQMVAARNGHDLSDPTPPSDPSLN